MTEHEIENVASFFCAIAGIEPIDSLDGSSNWWMYREKAIQIIKELRNIKP